jgi:hypothetical protein
MTLVVSHSFVRARQNSALTCKPCLINVDEFLTYLSSAVVHLLIAWHLKQATYIVGYRGVCWRQGLFCLGSDPC